VHGGTRIRTSHGLSETHTSSPTGRKCPNKEEQIWCWKPCHKTHPHESKSNNPWAIMCGCVLPSMVFILVENIKGADKDNYHEQQSEKRRGTGSSDGLPQTLKN